VLVNIHEAKTQLSKLVQLVQAGEEVVIGRNGTPVARLTQYQPIRHARVPGQLKGRLVIADDFDTTPDWLIDAFDGSGTGK
jgi:prevent-host-death family protein